MPSTTTAPSPAPPPVKVFYSYSHKDQALREALEEHLSTLRRQGIIANWHDRCISAGQEWKHQIDEHLESAQLILLLISASFIHSDYCYDIEMQRAIARHDVHEARVIPIYLRAVDWADAPFAKLQGLPTDAKPVTGWADQDAAFMDIARGVRKAALELQQQSAGSAALARPPTRAEAGDWRREYLATMADEWRTLRLAALDPTAADPHVRRPITLEQVYVSLDTSTPRPEKLRRKKKEGEFGLREEEPPLSAVEALWHAVEGHMVLVGQPGAGKTTFARHLALVMANVLRGVWELNTELAGWPGQQALLPVFASLGRLAAGIPESARSGTAAMVEDFICQQLDERPGLAGDGEALLQELKNAGGLVILDGLDEVPGRRRKLVKEVVTSFARRYGACKVLVTCRTHSYLKDEGWHLGWPEVHELAPFSREKIEAFIDAWYAALEAANPGVDYRIKAEKLKAALSPEDRRGLAELAGTPLMLTEMAIVHTNRNELPDSRVEVYRECVEILLLRWHTERDPQAPSLLDQLKEHDVSSGKLNRALQSMAYAAHNEAERPRLGGSEARALVGEGVIYKAMRGYLGDAGLQTFLDYCQHANGLLMAEGAVQPADAPPDAPLERVYAFPHLSFEEYLAACYLRELPKGAAVAANKAGDPAWREVVRFLGESWCFGRGANIDMAQALLERLCPVRQCADDPDWRRAWLAGELLRAVRREAAEDELRQELDQRIVARLVELLATPSALASALQDRAAAGRVLSALEDPRPGVSCVKEGRAAGLPEMAWVAIPGIDSLRLGNGLKPETEFKDEDEAWPADAPPLKIRDFYTLHRHNL